MVGQRVLAMKINNFYKTLASERAAAGRGGQAVTRRGGQAVTVRQRWPDQTRLSLPVKGGREEVPSVDTKNIIPGRQFLFVAETPETSSHCRPHLAGWQAAPGQAPRPSSALVGAQPERAELRAHRPVGRKQRFGQPV